MQNPASKTVIRASERSRKGDLAMNINRNSTIHQIANRPSVIALVLMIALVGFSATLVAQTIWTWIDTGVTGNWSDTANWDQTTDAGDVTRGRPMTKGAHRLESTGVDVSRVLWPQGVALNRPRNSL